MFQRVLRYPDISEEHIRALKSRPVHEQMWAFYCKRLIEFSFVLKPLYVRM